MDDPFDALAPPTGRNRRQGSGAADRFAAWWDRVRQRSGAVGGASAHDPGANPVQTNPVRTNPLLAHALVMRMLAALGMTGSATLAMGTWRTVGSHEFGLLAASSLFGIIIASTTYFAAIYVAGPRNTALLFALASPFSSLAVLRAPRVLRASVVLPYPPFPPRP